jgi:aryl-phospho-beta-D-glucosidase BglC (GH1 family)
MDFLASIRASFNLGNRFDFKCQPTDPASVNAVLDAYRAKGFDGVRISATWMRGTRCMLDDPAFMASLQSAVSHAVSTGYKVILDAHHEHWLYDAYTASELVAFKTLWQRIAKVFQAVPATKLAFDILNEPQGSLGDVGNCDDPVLVGRLRGVNEAGYKGVRAVSPMRPVIFEPGGCSSIYCLAAVYPDRASLGAAATDPNVAVSVHIYGPTTFCLPLGGTNAGMTVDAVRKNVDNKIKLVQKWQAASKIPLHVGEFGVGCTATSGTTTDRRDSDVVREHYRYFAARFKQVGIVTTIWDDSGDFGLYANGKWLYGIADAYMQGLSAPVS